MSADVKIEYAVELTWPDGRTEICQRQTVLDASEMYEIHQSPNLVTSARLMVRTVTFSEWQEAKVHTE